MGIHAYIDINEVKKMPGYQEKARRDNFNNEAVDCFVDKARISFQSGNAYIDLSNMRDRLPENLIPSVKEYTMEGWEIFASDRELGNYFLREENGEVLAEAKLLQVNKDYTCRDQTQIKIVMRSVKMENMARLYDLLINGTIRPELHYANQLGMSTKELEDNIKLLEDELAKEKMETSQLRQTNDDLFKMYENLDQKANELIAFFFELKKASWWSKKRILDKLSKFV